MPPTRLETQSSKTPRRESSVRYGVCRVSLVFVLSSFYSRVTPPVQQNPQRNEPLSNTRTCIVLGYHFLFFFLFLLDPHSHNDPPFLLFILFCSAPYQSPSSITTIIQFKKGDIFFNYGCFPQTWEDPTFIHPDAEGCRGDNDPLDVCEIGARIIPPGVSEEGSKRAE